MTEVKTNMLHANFVELLESRVHYTQPWLAHTNTVVELRPITNEHIPRDLGSLACHEFVPKTCPEQQFTSFLLWVDNGKSYE